MDAAISMRFLSDGGGRQDLRLAVRDQNGIFIVGRPFAVQRLDGPAVAHLLDGRRTGVHHGFDCKRHAAEEPGPPAGMAVIGDLRRLVHLGADTVADVFPDDGVAVTLHVLLDAAEISNSR